MAHRLVPGSSRWSTVAVLAVIGSISLTACGTPQGSATTVSSGPTAPADPPPASPVSPSAAPSLSPSSSQAAALCAKEFETCPLPAGTYRADPFTPAFTFALEGDWINDRAWPDGGGVSTDTGGFFWASDVKAGIQNGVEVEFEPTVEAFAAHLHGFDGWDVQDADPAIVDGLEATVIDVASRDVDGRGMYLVANDAFNLAPGEKARFLLLERDGRLVVLVIDAFKEADFEDVLERVRPVVDSIRWQ